jgi:protein-S-isoprenylcysteine O-methyltransferase Ste14
MSFLIEFKPPRIALGLVLLAALMHAMAPLSLHPNLPGTAIVLAVSGFGLMLRAWWLFRQANTAICPTAESSTLISRDVYAITRNPMYLGILMMLVAAGIATGGVGYYAAAALFGLAIDRIFCPYEEQKALREFGDEYRRYRRAVRRWL